MKTTNLVSVFAFACLATYALACGPVDDGDLSEPLPAATAGSAGSAGAPAEDAGTDAKPEADAAPDAPSNTDKDKDGYKPCVDGKLDGLCDCNDAEKLIHPGIIPVATCASLEAQHKPTTDAEGNALDLNCDGIPDPCPEADAGTDAQPDAEAPECKYDSDCSDGTFCNGTEKCQNSKCVGGDLPDCSDGIASTTDSCDEATASCKHVQAAQCAYNSDCSDGKYCNGVEKCTSGQCQAGTAVNCDDGVASTVDACNDTSASCTHTQSAQCAFNSDCSNGLYCDGVEQCQSGQCKAGTAPDCDDGIASTTDSCDNASASCKHVQAAQCAYNSDCSDGKYCNGVEKCTSGQCQSGTAVNCDDGVASTVDACNDTTASCTHTGSQTCTPGAMSTNTCVYTASLCNQGVPGYYKCNTAGTGYDVCAPRYVYETGYCSDSVDNDCDGNIDSADGDCYTQGTCGGTTPFKVVNFSGPSGTTSIEWRFHWCSGTASVVVTGGTNASVNTTSPSAVTEPLTLNARLSPIPAMTYNGAPVSEWLCQEDVPGNAAEPFGTPVMQDNIGPYVQDGKLTPGATLVAGHCAYAHDVRINGGWGCNHFCCPRGGSSCVIPH